MKPLRKKLIMLILSFLLLIAVVIYATTAWFTKMVSTANMKFTVAKWDFTADQMLDDMTLNIYDYASLNDNLVAPGTNGYIPIELSAKKSDSDVDYYITVDKSNMSDEFKQRINIYYLDADSVRHDFKNDGNDMSGTLARGTSTTITLYWEWIYEPTFTSTEDQALTDAEKQAKLDAFNAYDTKVGKNPTLYAKYMNATIKIAGVQVVPAATPTPTPTP
jgi:hypothetical protein